METIPAKDTWITSDLHFYHKNVIKYANRPFKDVEEMNAKMIQNINERVKIGDDLYILGDVAFANKEKIINILNQIACKNLYLILGNHDQAFRDGSLNHYFKKVCDYMEIKVPDDSQERGEVLVVMCHYPILEWNQGHRGSIMTHGHTHGNLQYPEQLKNKKIFDVGVDCWEYVPLNMKELVKISSTRENIIHHD